MQKLLKMKVLYWFIPMKNLQHPQNLYIPLTVLLIIKNVPHINLYFTSVLSRCDDRKSSQFYCKLSIINDLRTESLMRPQSSSLSVHLFKCVEMSRWTDVWGITSLEYQNHFILSYKAGEWRMRTESALNLSSRSETVWRWTYMKFFLCISAVLTYLKILESIHLLEKRNAFRA